MVTSALVIASCSGGALPLSQRIVSPPASYVSEPQDPTNNPTGAQTIQQIARTVPQDVNPLRSCGWVAGQYRYWEGGIPSRVMGNDWGISVNQFTHPQGARCFQAFVSTQLVVSSNQARSSVASLPGSVELSQSLAAFNAVHVLFTSGTYWVTISAVGPHVTKALVERIAKEQNKLLR